MANARRNRTAPCGPRLLACLAVLASVLLPSSALAQSNPSAGPLDQIALANLGNTDATLRGRTVSASYFFPGPGNYELNDDNWLDLDFQPSDLLASQSELSVLWNGVPIKDYTIGGAVGRQHATIHLDKSSILADFNRLDIQGYLQLTNDTCGVDPPGRYVALFDTTDVRYGYVSREPQTVKTAPDLSQYPFPFLPATTSQAAQLRFVLPPDPSSATLSAMARMAAGFGQLSGGRSAQLDLATADTVNPQTLAGTDVVLLGRADQQRALLGDLQNVPLARASDGSFLGPDGQPVPAGEGVIMEVPSPWSPGRWVLVATGVDDDGVMRAATTLGSSAAMRALRGAYALVPQIQAPAGADQAAVAGKDAAIHLSDLGRGDQTVSGLGDHTISFSFDPPTNAEHSGMTLSLDLSHSALVDQNRSSLRVVLNGVPLSSTTFASLAPQHASVQVQLPASALRPGSNGVDLQFSLYLPTAVNDNAITGDCAAVPEEQAWAVVHADSSVSPLASSGGPQPAAVTLASYPYPIVQDGAFSDARIVVPDDHSADGQLLRLMADLGRGTRAPLLQPTVVRASEINLQSAPPAQDLLLLGLPSANPLIPALGSHAPIQLGADRRLVFSRDISLAVRDTSNAGVVEEVASPWASGKYVVVVTATSADALPLAVSALRQGGLTGNAALVTPQANPAAPALAAPRLAVAGPAPLPLQVTSYTLPIAGEILAPGQKPPYVLAAAVVVGLVIALTAAWLVYQAYAPGPRRRP